MAENKNKLQNKKNQPNTKTKKTSRKQSEILRFQNHEILGVSVSLHDDIAISASKRWLEKERHVGSATF